MMGGSERSKYFKVVLREYQPAREPLQRVARSVYPIMDVVWRR